MILVRCEHLKNGRYALRSPWNEQLIEEMKRIPGLTWDKPGRTWVGYADAIPILEKRMGRSAKFINVPQQPVEPPVEDKRYDVRLHAYQRIGIDFIKAHAREGVILADCMGLGKTSQTLFSIMELGLPAVIVCPNVVKGVWRNEAKKWLGIDTVELSGTSPPADAKITAADGIAVINYDIVYAWAPHLTGAQVVAFDEVHNLSGSKSRRADACKALASEAPYRIALSGTPMTNRPRDLWNVVDTISPGRMGRFIPTFAKRYCNGHQKEIEARQTKDEMFEPDGRPRDPESRLVWDTNGASNIPELNERLRWFMLRRTKEDVALELPPKTRQIVPVDGIPAEPIDWSLSTAKSVRRSLTTAAMAKVPAAASLIEEHLASGSAIVAFCHERAVVAALGEALVAKGIEFLVATGAESAETRRARASEAARRVQNEEVSVLLVTRHSMGEGVDLSFADVAVNVELDYVPARLMQGEGRLHRQGQIRNVLIQYLIATGTVDEAIKHVIINKLDVFEQVVGKVGDDIKNDLRGKSEDENLAELRDMILRGEI